MSIPCKSQANEHTPQLRRSLLSAVVPLEAPTATLVAEQGHRVLLP